MYSSRSQTPNRRGVPGTPSTPSMRPTSSISSRAQTPSSTSRLRSSRFGDRPAFTPVRERPSSSLSFGGSRPTTPSVLSQSQPYTGSISVAIRAKPSETFLKDPWLLGEETIQHNEVGEFKFDHVFQPHCSNASVYEKSVKNLIESLMDGYNATVFAYGMTGSGKTYSMTGTHDEPGVIPLSIGEIFSKIEASDKEIYKFDLKVSYMEIYNERIYDLLNVDQLKGAALNTTSSDLKIRDVPGYGVKVVGLVEEKVTSEADVLHLMDKGNLNRRTGETDFNTRSSRSHAIFLVRISKTNTVTGMENFATLSLCDLAGSERATGQSERRKEGSFINKSLLALGSVIVKLSSPSTNAGHINYRDSKLTRILQPALSGDAVVSILCTIHTSNTALAETINTVRFAARAKNITLTVRKHETDTSTEKDRVIEKLKIQVERQQEEIASLKSQKTISLSTIQASEGLVPEDIKEQITELTAENKILMERVEHFTRLTDQRNAEKMVLKNEIVNDIISKSSDSKNSEELIIKIEELFKKTFSEIDEYKSYIGHLENQLKKRIQDTENRVPSSNDHDHIVVRNNADMDVNGILRDQEEEIINLKNELRGKEKIIKALQSTRRVRESLVHTIGLNESRRESSRHDTLKPLNLDLNTPTKLKEETF